MDHNQIWQAVLGEIELNLSRANFITWFKNTYISYFENNQIIISVPNHFTQAWLQKKYQKKIRTALENITKEKITHIEYKINSNKKPIFNFFNSDNKKTKILPSKEEKKNQHVFLKNSKTNLNSKYTFESFIVGKSNELAHAACQAICKNPGNIYNPLFIYGGVGLGKTHLLQAIGNKLLSQTDKILYTTSENFTNNYIHSIKSGNAKDFKEKYRKVNVLLIDDIQFMGGKDGTQQEFFHTFNELHQSNRQIIITSDRPPKSISAIEKRLISRFEQGMIADVSQPDIETKIAILDKKCQEKNFPLELNIIDYIVNNITNNIRELEGALNRIIAFHEFNNIKPSLKSIKTILENIILNTPKKIISPKQIIEIVANFYNLSPKEIVGQKRQKEIAWARQVSIYLIRETLGTSYPTIGKEIGGRDHTTALHACKKIEKEIKENQNQKIEQELNSIEQLIKNEIEK